MNKLSKSARALTGCFLAVCCFLLACPALGQEENEPNPQGEPRYFGEPISLSLRDADLAETLRSFAQLGNFNLVLDPAISGKVTVELKNVPWDQALEQILKVHGLGMDITGGQLFVASSQTIAQSRAERQRKLEAVHSVQLELENADAAAVVACFRYPQANILTEAGSAKAPKGGNTLVLRDRAARLLEIGRLLTRLDIPQAAKESRERLQSRCLKHWRELAGAESAEE